MSEGMQGGGGVEGAQGGRVPSSRGAMEVGGGEVHGRGTGQKMGKSFLVCDDGADGFRWRRSLHNSMGRARGRHLSHWSAAGARSMGSSANSGLVS